MHQFEIQPREGVGPVKLGMTRAQVRDSLSRFPDNELDQTEPTLDYAFGNSLQVEYDDQRHVQFIGVSFHSDCGCDFTFQGRHIGDYSARELFKTLAELDGESHDYNRDEYFFPNIRMTVWEADAQYDELGGESRPVYGQVGVASERYRDG